MALEKIVRYTEKDIEDWLWKNPNKVDWVDGWIERQLILLDNSRLDLLGYKKADYGDFSYLVLVELKSNPLKHEDLFQIINYEKRLHDTIDHVGLPCLEIEKHLIGTDTQISTELLNDANNLDIALHSMEIDKDDQLDLCGKWDFTTEYYKGLWRNGDYLMRSNRLDKLIEFLLPQMEPDLVDFYRDLVATKKRSVSNES